MPECSYFEALIEMNVERRLTLIWVVTGTKLHVENFPLNCIKLLLPEYWTNEMTIPVMHRSAKTLWPLTGEMTNTNHLFMVACVRWDILGIKWPFRPQRWCVKSRKNGQAWGFEQVWQGSASELQLLCSLVCNGEYLLKLVQGRNTCEPVTGSWAAKAQWCMWGMKASCCELL